jgi:hypothetical protein
VRRINERSDKKGNAEVDNISFMLIMQKKWKCSSLIECGEVTYEIQVFGAEDVSLIIERCRIRGDVDFRSRVKDESLVHRALLRCDGSK